MSDSTEHEQALMEILAKHVHPYDAETDDYYCPPFSADIKEGKNDPIYNVHSYHTKVPPRIIIPYILHYTQPGDLVLDPFCGSGMTGVAAQMCAKPPADILESFPEYKDRVGPRACILNDLSPAACHIAYNYNTPVDVDALKREFERIKAAVKDEFDWLYGTEHYEPAVGLYDPANADVAGRLKNPPAGGTRRTLFGDEERTWELLTKDEVEMRLGYPVTELPRDNKLKDLDVAKVERWVCIPAMTQHTIWSDVYRCEGFVTTEEPTGKVSTRGKNEGKPITRKSKVQRGCGKSIVLWAVSVDKSTGAVTEDFKCPHCGQDWQKLSLEFQQTSPVHTSLMWHSIRNNVTKSSRPVSLQEQNKLAEIDRRPVNAWYPNGEIWSGRELMTMGANRKGVRLQSDFYTKRNLAALALLNEQIEKTVVMRLRKALSFCFTAIVLKSSRLDRLRPSGAGDPLTASLYVASLIREENVAILWNRRVDNFLKIAWSWQKSRVCVTVESATRMEALPSNSVDYVFTDPPFGGNIYYADASLLWEAWLDAFTDESKELVFNRQRFRDAGFKTLSDYADGMRQSFSEVFRVLKPGRWCTVEFNNSDGMVFQVIKSAIESVGFEIANMLLLDKKQKSFKQVKGAKGEEDVVDKDVVFNLHKPAFVVVEMPRDNHDLELQVAEAVRLHLQSLPERIKADPAKYNDEHRTTATINSMLMNTLIPRGVDVQRLDLPFIQRVCGRYFRKVGQHWYLRGEAVGINGGGLLPEEVTIKDEMTAIAWLRQILESRPALIGELKPLWMRATGLLPAATSQSLVLEDLLISNFWRDEETNRWREPTPVERDRMNDDKTIRVLHDAERYVTGSLRRQTTETERCEWIDALFKMCRALEENDAQVLPSIRDLSPDEGYRLIGRLFQGILKDKVTPAVYSRAAKQAGVGSQRTVQDVKDKAEKAKAKRRKDEGPTLFDL